MMNINIRHERESEHHLVEELTREAFWNLYVPGCEEHWIVNRVRKHKDFIPELSFVIELDGEIVGSIFYTKSRIVLDSGGEKPTISFGPVSIIPSLHRKGLGRALITHSIDAAKSLGHESIIIGGYTYHYAPYGFVGAKKYGIAMPDGKFYKGIMALPLKEGALDGISGKVFFCEALVHAGKEELEEFDKNFPKKEKSVRESQKEFELASQEIDE